MILDACLAVVASGGLKNTDAAVLCDEEYGDAVLRKAKAKGIAFALPVEKSGQTEFRFEYGNNYGEHITRYNPPYAKVLVRYNPANKTINRRQLARLARLQSWLDRNNRKLLFELLLEPTVKQLAECGGNRRVFDAKLRPKLTRQAISEIAVAGIRPEVWKLEGVDSTGDAEIVFGTAKRATPTALIIVLGRGESEEHVKKWIRVAAKWGCDGFAVGRTIFQAPLEQYASGGLGKREAVARMARTYAALAKEFKTANRA